MHEKNTYWMITWQHVWVSHMDQNRPSQSPNKVTHPVEFGGSHCHVRNNWTWYGDPSAKKQRCLTSTSESVCVCAPSCQPKKNMMIATERLQQKHVRHLNQCLKTQGYQELTLLWFFTKIFHQNNVTKLKYTWSSGHWPSWNENWLSHTSQTSN